MTPEIALGNQLEPSRFDLAAQRTLLDAMQGLADCSAIAGSRGVVRNHQRPARL
jgi:hypothetical protein